MKKSSWKHFPKALVRKINSLLDEAEPNKTKSFMLYKACKNENLWNNSYELFTVHLSDYFSVNKNERAKSYFDQFLDRPMDRYIYDQFQLNFRTAAVNSASLKNTTHWAQQMLADHSETSAVTTIDIIEQTLLNIIHPDAFEKEHSIEFEDFCISWKKTVFKFFGKTYNHELEIILKELRWLNKLPEIEENNFQLLFKPSIYLTQTETMWVNQIQKAVFENSTTPHYPLMRGPEKEKLSDLLRTASLFNKVIDSVRPEITIYHEKIRDTLLSQCSELLNNCYK